MHGNVLANVGPEEVVSLVDVFGSRSTVGIHCNLQDATIVWEDSAMDLCSSGVDGVPELLCCFWQPDNRKSVLKGFSHAHMFSVGCGRSND